MAGAAGGSAGLADVLCDVFQVDRSDHLACAGVLRILGDNVPGKTDGLLVLARGVMADQAIDVGWALKSNLSSFQP